MNNSGPKAVVRKSFSAPVERVFDAWLITTQLGNWMFGPKVRDEKILELNNEVRVGGKFSFVVLRGGQKINHTGEYQQIRRPEILVFSWGIEGEAGDSRVIVEIQADDGKSRLKLTHELDPAWADYVEQTKKSWAHMLSALATLLEQKQPALFR